MLKKAHYLLLKSADLRFEIGDSLLGLCQALGMIVRPDRIGPARGRGVTQRQPLGPGKVGHFVAVPYGGGRRLLNTARRCITSRP